MRGTSTRRRANCTAPSHRRWSQGRGCRRLPGASPRQPTALTDGGEGGRTQAGHQRQQAPRRIPAPLGPCDHPNDSHLRDLQPLGVVQRCRGAVKERACCARGRAREGLWVCYRGESRLASEMTGGRTGRAAREGSRIGHRSLRWLSPWRPARRPAVHSRQEVHPAHADLEHFSRSPGQAYAHVADPAQPPRACPGSRAGCATAGHAGHRLPAAAASGERLHT